MAIALVAKTALNAAVVSNGANLQNTTGINTTGATVHILCVSWGGVAGSVAVTDTASNTYTLAKAQQQAADSSNAIYYCFSPSTGTAVKGQITNNTGAGNRLSIQLFAFSGTVTTGLDGTPTGGQISGSSPTAVQPGSITPSGSGALLVTGSGGNGLGATSIVLGGGTNDSGFTTDTTTASWDAGNAYLIQPGAATATNPKWTYTGDAQDTAVMICIAASGGGGGGGGTLPPAIFVKQAINRAYSF
jgi:hypothetical protein